MPSLWKAFSSSSSSVSSSPSESPLTGNHLRNFSPFGSSRSVEGGKRLMRQRKLRHATDDELGLGPSGKGINDRSKSMPVSPDFDAGYGSPSPARLEHWSKSAVPQPLPLPEMASLFKQNHTEGVPNRGDGDPSDSGITSKSSRATPGKATENVEGESSKFPTYRRRGFHEDLNVKGTRQNFRLNISARSAPSSGFSSPVLSPQRFSTVDRYHPSLLASPLDAMVGFSTQVSPTRIIPSPDHSPLHSPKARHPSQHIGNYNGIAVHSHNKSLPEHSLWADGNKSNVHLLPLPPGVSRSSQSPTVYQNLDKPEITTVRGQWQKGRLLGRGTYGSVYVATNRITGAYCAMKEVELAPDDPKSAECIKQLEQEIKVLEQLKHPNIVQYYGTEIVDDHFCIYLEYVHPGSLNKYIREHCGVMTESIVRNFTRHILSGLAYLHSTKTIHRDIKGANLLVDASGVVKLADFGLAKHLSGCVTDLSLKGSPHWMAPEVLQAVLRKDANPELALAIDIWSLGCTVIEMLTGKPPWNDLNGVQAMFSVLHKSPPIPETLSSEGKDFLRCCLQRKPADRPSALMLLEHPFVRNSHDQNADIPRSSKDWMNHYKDLTVSGNSVRQGELLPSSSSETCKQSHPETSDPGAALRHHSPRSTLEALPFVFDCRAPNVNASVLMGTENRNFFF